MKRGISIKLDSVMVERLDGVAVAEERSRTQVIDRALRQWFASQANASAAPTQPPADGDAPA